ncbi:UMP-CMP kinase 2, mitochondrial [Osmerus eperlanus]|uniref:UMP-CMP kinase 2, mitochondrial n=1 Tax=Osmerus eperlanus TaxID=29151 RepID=UPI002E148865
MILSMLGHALGSLKVGNSIKSRRIMSRFGSWSSCVFSIELDKKSDPIYFSLQDSKRNELLQGFKNVFTDGKCYSLHVDSNDRIQKAKFYASLKDKLMNELPSDCQIHKVTSFQPHVRDSVIKGYFLKDFSKSSVATEGILKELLHGYPVVVCSYVSGGGGGQFSQHLWSRTECGNVEVTARYSVVPAEAPDYHPSTLNIINSDVFYSFEDAYSVLEECGDVVPGSRAVLELVDQRLQTGEKTHHPVIVIEGLDATGKTTLTQSLREALGASLLRSPPQCLAPWRGLFDQEPPLLRRAFYALGNYITAGQIGQEATHTPVIVDRYWHSTAAYAIATAVGGTVNNLPQGGSEVYRWPDDLLQPSLVILLTLDPHERRRRLQGRGQDKTQEEEELEADHLFRLKVEEAYHRIEGPPCVTVDASPSQDRVLQQVLLLIRDKCHL